MSRIFLNGLAIVLPAVLTLALLWWFGSSLETALGSVLRLVLPAGFYFPGLGIVAGVALIFAVGFATRVWLARRMFELASGLMERVPVVKTLFCGIRDFMKVVQHTAQASDENQVVLVEVMPGIRFVGFVTTGNSAFHYDERKDWIAVYFQMSYQLGGYATFVERDKVTFVDMPLDEAMQWVLTAGISGPPDTAAVGKPPVQ
ncbi:MAG: putative membrane protein [Gammaproteobacteria bacterium]|jgi:uncharacterized membrane protein